MTTLPHAKDTVDWAVHHAQYGPDGRWRCLKTGAIMRIQKIWKTIGADEDFPFSGLEVKRVAHVFCPRCVPIPQFELYGSPISLKNLIGYQP